VSLVADASTVVAALVDGGEVGEWARGLLEREPLDAPHHMPVEAANVLRRAAASGDISADVASLAHADLLDLRVRLFSYKTLAERVWQLRSNVTVYDGCYVALAEELSTPLATLDVRLSRASGPRCEFLIPPETALRRQRGSDPNA
jgi:predicted nucleic acid-binding protein